MMTKKKFVLVPKRPDVDVFGARAYETGLRILSSTDREQPQELRCVITVIVDCLFDGFNGASGASRGW